MEISEKIYFSKKFFPLGDCWPEILAAMRSAGYSFAVDVAIDSIERHATSESERDSLRIYWHEAAKERLAALVGPVDIFLGKFPAGCAYRSVFLDNLRLASASRLPNPAGSIDSPQIEPVFKKFLDTTLGSVPFLERNSAVKAARESAAQLLHLSDSEEFKDMHASSRYEMLRDRYFSSLVPLGFELSQQRKKSMIFRKKIHNTPLDFIFVDESGDGVDTGFLAPSIAVVRAGASLKVREIPSESILFFLPNQIVPQFQYACGFPARSHGQFLLAADSILFFIKMIFEKINQIDFSEIQ